jgi:hypothetical protein
VIIKEELAQPLPILGRIVDTIVTVLANVELHPLGFSWNGAEIKTD